MHNTKKYLDDYNGQEKERNLAQNDVRCEDENFNVNDEDPPIDMLFRKKNTSTTRMADPINGRTMSARFDGLNSDVMCSGVTRMADPINGRTMSERFGKGPRTRPRSPPPPPAYSGVTRMAYPINGKSLAGFEAVSKYKAIEKEFRMCGKCNVRLTLFFTPHDNFFCDKCKTRFPSNSKMFGCRDCDYDHCPECFHCQNPNTLQYSVPRAKSAWSLKPNKVPDRIASCEDLSLGQILHILKKENDLRLSEEFQEQCKISWELEDGKSINAMLAGIQYQVAMKFPSIPTCVVINTLKCAEDLVMKIPPEKGGGLSGIEEVKKVCHYRKYNKMENGDLKMGDDAPDAPLLHIDSSGNTSVHNLLEGNEVLVIIAGSSS